MTNLHYIALVCGAGLTALGKFGPELIGLYPTIGIIAAWICAGVSAAVAVRSQNGPTEIHELGASILMGPIVWVVAVMATKKKEKYIVRTYSAGVFYGEIKSRKGQEVVMANAIRLWRWAGAASLSQMAEEGVKVPGGCKFAVPVREVILTQAIEILSTTAAARNSIEGVVPWRV